MLKYNINVKNHQLINFLNLHKLFALMGLLDYRIIGNPSNPFNPSNRLTIKKRSLSSPF